MAERPSIFDTQEVLSGFAAPSSSVVRSGSVQAPPIAPSVISERNVIREAASREFAESQGFGSFEPTFDDLSRIARGAEGFTGATAQAFSEGLVGFSLSKDKTEFNAEDQEIINRSLAQYADQNPFKYFAANIIGRSASDLPLDIAVGAASGGLGYLMRAMTRAGTIAPSVVTKMDNVITSLEKQIDVLANPTFLQTANRQLFEGLVTGAVSELALQNMGKYGDAKDVVRASLEDAIGGVMFGELFRQFGNFYRGKKRKQLEEELKTALEEVGISKADSGPVVAGYLTAKSSAGPEVPDFTGSSTAPTVARTEEEVLFDVLRTERPQVERVIEGEPAQEFLEHHKILDEEIQAEQDLMRQIEAEENARIEGEFKETVDSRRLERARARAQSRIAKAEAEKLRIQGIIEEGRKRRAEFLASIERSEGAFREKQQAEYLDYLVKDALFIDFELNRALQEVRRVDPEQRLLPEGKVPDMDPGVAYAKLQEKEMRMKLLGTADDLKQLSKESGLSIEKLQQLRDQVFDKLRRDQQGDDLLGANRQVDPRAEVQEKLTADRVTPPVSDRYGDMHVGTAQEFVDMIMHFGRGMEGVQAYAKVALEFMKTRAKIAGKTLGEYLSEKRLRYMDTEGNSHIIFDDAETVIRGARNSESLGDLFHEIGHVLEQDLSLAERKLLAKHYFPKNKGKLREVNLFGRNFSERFANDFVTYLDDVINGRRSDQPKGLKAIFNKVAKWLKGVSRVLLGESHLTGPMHHEVRGVFDRLFDSDKLAPLEMSRAEFVARGRAARTRGSATRLEATPTNMDDDVVDILRQFRDGDIEATEAYHLLRDTDAPPEINELLDEYDEGYLEYMAQGMRMDPLHDEALERGLMAIIANDPGVLQSTSAARTRGSATRLDATQVSELKRLGYEEKDLFTRSLTEAEDDFINDIVGVFHGRTKAEALAYLEASLADRGVAKPDSTTMDYIAFGMLNFTDIAEVDYPLVLSNFMKAATGALKGESFSPKVGSRIKNLKIREGVELKPGTTVKLTEIMDIDGELAEELGLSNTEVVFVYSPEDSADGWEITKTPPGAYQFKDDRIELASLNQDLSVRTIDQVKTTLFHETQHAIDTKKLGMHEYYDWSVEHHERPMERRAFLMEYTDHVLYSTSAAKNARDIARQQLIEEGIEKPTRQQVTARVKTNKTTDLLNENLGSEQQYILADNAKEVQETMHYLVEEGGVDNSYLASDGLMRKLQDSMPILTSGITTMRTFMDSFGERGAKLYQKLRKGKQQEAKVKQKHYEIYRKEAEKQGLTAEKIERLEKRDKEPDIKVTMGGEERTIGAWEYILLHMYARDGHNGSDKTRATSAAKALVNYGYTMRGDGPASKRHVKLTEDEVKAFASHERLQRFVGAEAMPLVATLRNTFDATGKEFGEFLKTKTGDSLIDMNAEYFPKLTSRPLDGIELPSITLSDGTVITDLHGQTEADIQNILSDLVNNRGIKDKRILMRTIAELTSLNHTRRGGGVMEFQNPLRAMSTHLDSQARLMGLAEPVADMQVIFGNVNVRQKIKDTLGESSDKAIQTMIGNLVGVRQSSRILKNSFADRMYKGQVLSALSWNLSPILKQIPAIFTSVFRMDLPGMGIGERIGFATRMITESISKRKELHEEMMQRFPTYYERYVNSGVSPDISDVSLTSHSKHILFGDISISDGFKGGLSEGGKNLVETGMRGIREADAATIRAVYLGVEESLRRQGKLEGLDPDSVDELIEEVASEIIDETQGSAHGLNRTVAQSSDGFFDRQMAMFSSESTQQFNMVLRDYKTLRSIDREKNPEAYEQALLRLQSGLVGLTVNALGVGSAGVVAMKTKQLALDQITSEEYKEKRDQYLENLGLEHARLLGQYSDAVVGIIPYSGPFLGEALKATVLGDSYDVDMLPFNVLNDLKDSMERVNSGEVSMRDLITNLSNVANIGFAVPGTVTQILSAPLK